MKILHFGPGIGTRDAKMAIFRIAAKSQKPLTRRGFRATMKTSESLWGVVEVGGFEFHSVCGIRPRDCCPCKEAAGYLREKDTSAKFVISRNQAQQAGSAEPMKEMT